MLKNNNELKDLLDSDDELPTEYNEEPELPAYLDDQRFNPIKFNWIKNNKTRRIPVEPDIIPAPTNTHDSKATLPTSSTSEQSSSDRNLIKKGILNEQDIICMKSVAAQAPDASALLWFIDFLMYKDLQSEYTFLKSCLVIHQDNYDNLRQMFPQRLFPKSLGQCFELIVM